MNSILAGFADQCAADKADDDGTKRHVENGNGNASASSSSSESESKSGSESESSEGLFFFLSQTCAYHCAFCVIPNAQLCRVAVILTFPYRQRP